MRGWMVLLVALLLVPAAQAQISHEGADGPHTTPTLNISANSYDVPVGAQVRFNGTTTGGSSTIGVVNTIGVGSFPFGIAYYPAKQEMFVTNDESNNVSVINDATGRVTANINVGTAPDIAAYDPVSNEVFVGNCGSANVSVIDAATLAVVANVNAGPCPSGIAYDNLTNDMYVVNNGGNNISVIGGSSHTLAATVALSASACAPHYTVCPLADAYDPVMNEVFVTVNDGTSVAVVDAQTNSVAATLTVGNGPAGIAYDPVKGEMFVADSQDNAVDVIDDSTATVAATIGVGSSPYAIGYVQSKGQVFAMNQGAGTVSIVNDTTLSVVQTVNVEDDPAWCAFDSARGQVYVANYESGTVSVIQYGWSIVYQFGDGNSSSTRNPTHTYTIPGTYHVWAWFNSTAANVHSELNLTIYKGGGKPPPSTTMISGFVENESQAPLSGAEVGTNWGNISWANNTQGYYTLTIRSSYKYANVCANASGYAYQCYNATLTGAGVSLNFYLSPENVTQATIQGTIKGCGDALSGVLIELYLGSNLTNTTLADGSYSLGLITPVAEYEVRASKSGYMTVYTNVSTTGLVNYLNLTMVPDSGCSSNGGGGGVVVYDWLIVNESYVLLIVLVLLGLLVLAALYRRLRE